MNISCPKCNFTKTVDPAKVPDRPVKVNCPKCKETFTFTRETGRTAGTAKPVQRKITCPACGLVQSYGANCSGCGIDYAKYRQQMETKKLNGGIADLRRKAVAQAPQNNPKAGFWLRVVATIIDSVLLTIVQFLLTLGITLLIGTLGIAAVDDPAISMVIWLFGMSISIGYAVFFVGYCGQTPGKMALRIKVIRTDGGPMIYGRAVKREILGKFVSSVLLGIGYIMVAFDSQKQGLHDKIANTYVIKL